MIKHNMFYRAVNKNVMFFHLILVRSSMSIVLPAKAPPGSSLETWNATPPPQYVVNYFQRPTPTRSLDGYFLYSLTSSAEMVYIWAITDESWLRVWRLDAADYPG